MRFLPPGNPDPDFFRVWIDGEELTILEAAERYPQYFRE